VFFLLAILVFIFRCTIGNNGRSRFAHARAESFPRNSSDNNLKFIARLVRNEKYKTYRITDRLDTSVHKDSKVIFKNLDDTVYVMASSWGLTGDHIEIVVSSLPIANRGSSAASDYIFYEPTIYYKKEGDTLVVYSPSIAVIPDNFKSSVNITQVQVRVTRK
jgi:hypothetical protein